METRRLFSSTRTGSALTAIFSLALLAGCGAAAPKSNFASNATTTSAGSGSAAGAGATGGGSLATGSGGSSSATGSGTGTSGGSAAGSGTTSGGSSSGTGSGSGSTPAVNTGSQYYKNMMAASNWMVSQSMLGDGAITYGSSAINPYYSNLAASGLTKDPSKLGQVKAWMQWYIAHLNNGDRWGLSGTMYDYNIQGGSEVSTGTADSTDSYAATFLSLAWDYYNAGGSKAYLQSISNQLNEIGTMLVNTQQSDGLTWAKPDYQIKYLMDNCEAYRGLRDLASVFQSVVGDSSKAAFFNQKADLMLQGINGMWMGNSWAIYKDGIGRLMAPNMATWYPDATAELFPVLYEVIPASDSRSQKVYANFNGAWPGWPNLSFNSKDSFPWVMVAGAAAQMGDSGRVGTYLETVNAKYVNAGFPWPWYSMEAGWYMRVANYTNGARPF
jgi:hypothetical protein